MRTLQAIVFSLLIHFTLVWLAQYLPPYTSQNSPVEIEIVDSNPSKAQPPQQVVRQVDTPKDKKIDRSLDKLRFLSEQTQDVRKQVRALKTGMTENRLLETGSRNQEKSNSPSFADGETTNPKKARGLDAFAPAYRKGPDFRRELDTLKGVSTIGEVLPEEVEIGSFTALNTDRYQHYSFFARIEELIRFRWETSVRATIDRTPQSEFLRGVNSSWITHIEIWLKPNGEFHSAHLLKPSGIPGFDQSAAWAFRDARVFPNPPKEMVEEGLIRLQYSFNVKFNPKTLVGR